MVAFKDDLIGNAIERATRAREMFREAVLRLECVKDPPEPIHSAMELNRRAVEDLTFALNTLKFVSNLEEDH